MSGLDHSRPPPGNGAGASRPASGEFSPDDEIAYYEGEIAAHQKALERVDRFLREPVQRSRRRHALHAAVVAQFEASAQTDRTFDALATHLPPDLRWTLRPEYRAHLGWVPEPSGGWRFDPERAPSLDVAAGQSEFDDEPGGDRSSSADASQ